jgi:hypothetical protein
MHTLKGVKDKEVKQQLLMSSKRLLNKAIDQVLQTQPNGGSVDLKNIRVGYPWEQLPKTNATGLNDPYAGTMGTPALSEESVNRNVIRRTA